MIYNVSYKRLYMYIYMHWTKHIYIHYNIEANVYMYHENMFAHLQVTMFDLFAISVLAFCISIIALLCTYIHISYTPWNAYAFSCICYMVECVMNLSPWQNDILVSGQLLNGFSGLASGLLQVLFAASKISDFHQILRHKVYK